jgi:hypothetical protein
MSISCIIQAECPPSSPKSKATHVSRSGNLDASSMDPTIMTWAHPHRRADDSGRLPRPHPRWAYRHPFLWDKGASSFEALDLCTSSTALETGSIPIAHQTLGEHNDNGCIGELSLSRDWLPLLCALRVHTSTFQLIFILGTSPAELSGVLKSSGA